jgi:murein DD-endopeptidase MepM/ murein hydrolase activator NlpD
MGILALLLGLSAAAAAALPTEDFGVVVLPVEPVQGQLVVVELLGVDGATAATAVSGSFGDRALHFYRDGAGRLRALSAVPLQQPPGKLSVTVRVERGGDGENPVIRSLPVKIRKGKFASQTLRVDPRFLQPPKRAYAQIAADNQALNALWAAKPTARQWRGNFVWPRQDKVGGGFGVRRVFNGTQRSRHWGVDIRGETGDPVQAIGTGTVVLVRDCYYSGGTVVIDHGLSLFSLYFHFSAYDVAVGDRVEQGQCIGKVGSTGRATGAHLHLSTKLGTLPFDPASLFQTDFTEEAPPARDAVELPAPGEPGEASRATSTL